MIDIATNLGVGELLRQGADAAAVAVHPLYGLGSKFEKDSREFLSAKEHIDTVALAALLGAVGDPSDVLFRFINCEGEKDESTHANGVVVGSGNESYDVALDQVDGTTNAAKGDGPVVCAIGAVARGNGSGALLGWHGIHYMDSIVVGPGNETELLKQEGASLFDKGDKYVFEALCSALQLSPADLRVAVLDRPRNSRYIKALRALGATPIMLSDGDLAPAVMTQISSEIHARVGIGGTPEAVLAAIAARAAGGAVLARYYLTNEKLHDHQHELLSRQRFTETTMAGSGKAFFAMSSMVPHPITGQKGPQMTESGLIIPRGDTIVLSTAKQL